MIRVPSSMLTCVMGFPAGSYTGLAFTSIFEIDNPGRSAPETGGVPFAAFSFSIAGSFAVTSVAIFR